MIVSREGTDKYMIMEGTGKFFVSENGNAGVFVSTYMRGHFGMSASGKASIMIMEGTGKFFVNGNGNAGVFVSRDGIWNVREREGHRL
jgi:ribosomal protein L24E